MVGLTSTASGQPFVSPIGGTPYVDWTIVNYSDLDATEGLVDYRGGNYTYNGHNAIDFALANFAAMDAGVPVYAAADGTVLFAQDGQHDRCSRVSPCGDFPNYIWIQHANGIVTDYLHLKKGSVNVSVGQQVVAGQQIALVGSSGLSSDAHLHFSVRQNGAFVETYQDPARWWINPVPYADDVAGSLDHGITNHFPSTTELVDRPLDHPVFQQTDGIGQQAVLWSHLHGIDAGDDFDFYYYRPDGTEYAHFHDDAPQIRYGWWFSAINLPTVPDLGTWTVDFRLNGSAFISDSFTVVGVLGDYDRNHTVDAADYVIWRDSLGQTVAPYQGADGDGDSLITTADFEIWQKNFGRMAPTASLGTAVPEPASLVVLIAGVCIVGTLAYRGRIFFPVPINL
jgi:hypothetical protein